jgi:hypothetical protein
MRQSLWSIGVGGLALGTLALLGGTAIGGEIGPLAAGYGILVLVAALYLVAGLAIRERAWRRVTGPLNDRARADRLAGPRVF